ncbi:hypothetical protein [Geomonas sp. Red276]
MGKPRPAARPSLLPPEAYLPGPTFLDQLADKIRALGKTAEAAHDRVESGILQQTVRLDTFFGTPNMEKAPGTSYHLVWRNSLRWEQGGKFAPGATVRADIALKRLDNRLNLIISGEKEPDPISPRLPQDPGNPGFDRTTQPARFVNTELRYQLRRTPTTYAFLGAGIDLSIPIQLFTRARYQYAYRISELSLARMAETFFVKSKAGLGETTELILERSLDPKSLLRWSNSGTVSQEIGAMEWGSELALLHELSSRSAITVGGSIFGQTAVDDWINTYVISARYRRNFWMPWLFYEVEPQVSWPRQADGAFPIVYAITCRLEIQFQGREGAQGQGHVLPRPDEKAALDQVHAQASPPPELAL